MRSLVDRPWRKPFVCFKTLLLLFNACTPFFTLVILFYKLLILAERQQMALRLVFDNEILTLATGQLTSTRLLGIEMVEARLASNYLTILG